MRPFPAEFLPRSENSQIGKLRKALGRHADRAMRNVLARWAARFDRHAHNERVIVDRHEGHSWCDQTERQLNDDVTSSRLTDF
jgi:hypothetical protein